MIIFYIILYIFNLKLKFKEIKSDGDELCVFNLNVDPGLLFNGVA